MTKKPYIDPFPNLPKPFARVVAEQGTPKAKKPADKQKVVKKAKRRAGARG